MESFTSSSLSSTCTANRAALAPARLAMVSLRPTLCSLTRVSLNRAVRLRQKSAVKGRGKMLDATSFAVWTWSETAWFTATKIFFVENYFMSTPSGRGKPHFARSSRIVTFGASSSTFTAPAGLAVAAAADSFSASAHAPAFAIVCTNSPT